MKKSYIHNVDSNSPLTSETLPDIWDQCLEEDENVGGKLIFHHPHEEFTRRQLYDQGMLVAKGLLAAGVKRGETLCCVGVVGSDAQILFIACSSIGVIFNGPCMYQPMSKIIEANIDKTEPSVVVFGDTTALGTEDPETAFDAGKKVLQQYKARNQATKVKLVLYDRKAEANEICKPESDWISSTKLIEMGSSVSDEELKKAKSKLDLNEPCCITMSSGSTGKSKFILLGSSLFTNMVKKTDQPLTQIIVLWWRMRCTCILTPNETSSDDRTIARQKLQLLQDYKLSAMPSSIYLTMIIEDEMYKDYDISSLKMIIVTGNLVTSEYKKKIAALAPMSKNMYGLSEFLDPVTAIPGVFTTNPDTVGKVSKNVELKIVDEEGVILPRNTAGEIWLRGYCMFIEYVNDPELTAAVKTKDGWFKTGDCGYIDDDDLVYIKGRMAGSERFKVEGDVVYPGTIESALSKHPKIRQIMVVGLQAPGVDGHHLAYAIIWAQLGGKQFLGLVYRVFCFRCRPRAGESLTVEEVKKFAMENTNWIIEWPHRVFFFESFPTTATSRRKFSRRMIQKRIEDMVAEDDSAGLVHYNEN